MREGEYEMAMTAYTAAIEASPSPFYYSNR